jgi:hypothetical protein
MRSWKLLIALLTSTLCFAAQPNRITGPVDSSQMVALAGHVNRNAIPQYDQGPVEPSFQLDYVTLVIAPSPSQQAALDQLLAQQQDRSSSNYHQWLTPAQYAERFGASQADVNQISAWLKSQGFQIVSIGGGRNSVVFSGTAGQIQSAFKTEIHRYEVNGEKHIANSTLLMIPAAFNGVVTGVRGLTDFHPKPMYVRPLRRSNTPGPHPSYTTTIGSNTDYFVAPGDIATMYDINPLYTATPAINGSGQKLAIIGQTDIYLADINDFRSGFGLNQITGCSTNSSGVVTATACNTTYFQYVPVGTDPGTPYTCGDLTEADLDLEWSGAIAQDAQIIYVNAAVVYDSSCNVTSGAGVDGALAAAINPPSGPPLAPVISMSYGLCEAETDSLETELQQGNVEGVTILNSAGDVGSTACDYSSTSTNPPFAPAVNGLAVSYPASSPEVTGVGGTSIPPTPTTNYSSTYWGSTNGSTGGSALSTLESLEAAWNDDAAFGLLCTGSPTLSFCDPSPGVKLTSAQTAQEDYWISAGGGGVSNCYNETGTTCDSGFTKPTWQTVTIPGLTSPQSTYRFVPDVSLLASPNFPGYIICTPQNEVVTGSTSTTSTCSPGGTAGISTAVDTYFSLVGGTSASTPVFAGIVTLLNQYLSGTSSAGLGNINPQLYTLAATPSNDAFHPIKTGESDVYCTAGTPAGQPADVICPTAGFVGFSATSFDATTGYNLVTGLGSVDADKLAIAWAATRAATTTATVQASSTTITAGDSVTLTATVTPTTAIGVVSFFSNGSATALGTGTLTSTSGGIATLQTTSLPVGTDDITATYGGSGTLQASTTAASTAVTVTQPDFTLAVTTPLTPASIPAGQSATAVLTVAPVSGSATVNFTPTSCTGLPVGATCSFNPSSATFGGVGVTGATTLTISTVANMLPPTGAQTITVTGTVGTVSHTATVSLTVTATNQAYTLTTNAAVFTAAQGATAAVNLTVTGTGSPINFVTGSATTLPLTYTCSTGTPSLATAEITCQLPNSGQPSSLSTATVSLVTTPPTTSQLRPLGRRGIFYALLLPGLFGLVFAAGSRTRGLRLLSLIVVLGFSTLWLGACGGSSGSGGSSGLQNAGTPAGTYTLTINATTGGTNPLTFSLPITLNVTAQ